MLIQVNRYEEKSLLVIKYTLYVMNYTFYDLCTVYYNPRYYEIVHLPNIGNNFNVTPK